MRSTFTKRDNIGYGLKDVQEATEPGDLSFVDEMQEE
jgi:hypothetical protein